MFVIILPSIALAQDDNQAGLVVVHGDNSTITRCVSFNEDELTGLQLLERSGLDLNYDAAGGFGAAVCRIDNEGCIFPQDSCFCQCEGNPCQFWSYWYWDDSAGDWVYSALGANNHSLGNGDVNAWVWNTGSSPDGESIEVTPPEIGYDEICVAATPTPTPGQPESPPGWPTATPTPSLTDAPSSASEPVSIPEPITLVLFGSGLAGLGLQAWRRRKGENR